MVSSPSELKKLPNLMKQYGIKIPSEHGAIYTFFLSSIASLGFAGDKAPVSILALMFLWLMGLTMQNFRLLVSVTTLAGGLLSYITGNLIYATIFLICLLGCLALKAGRRVREMIGMFGAAAMPIVLVSAGFDSEAQFYSALTFALSITGAAYGASFVVHTAINQINSVCVFEGILFLASVFLLLNTSPWLSLALVLPVLLQLVLRERLGSIGFKKLGLIQALFLTAVAISANIII